jgi:UDP-N-acetylmuramoyl-tripeptide--D-alanyl-D-alanine ligase
VPSARSTWIVVAKSEILSTSGVAVLNVDHPGLARLAGEQLAAGQRVRRCSASDPAADVSVVGGRLVVDGREVARVPVEGVHPGNLACAAAVAVELGVPDAVVAERVAGLPTPPNRLAASTAASGAVVLDDTYNANPAGSVVALAALARHGEPGARKVVVTPGMVELGRRQVEENRRFAAAAADTATHLVVVGHTNRRALLAGAADGTAEVVVVATREQAVAWVRQHVGEGDAVLYENDLPDHFP